jgi:hypothetical protein
MIPCQFFVLNQCRSGNTCRFSHDPAIARPGGANRPCHEFTTKGICRYGDLCVFVHRVAPRDGEEQQSAYYYGAQPASSELVGMFGEAPNNVRPNAGTSEPPKGTTWAKVARLPHQQAETERSDGKPAIQQVPVAKTVPVNPEKRPTTLSKVPCKFFFSEKGCRSGSECRFSHLAEEGCSQTTSRMPTTSAESVWSRFDSREWACLRTANTCFV